MPEMKNYRLYVDESGLPDLAHPDRNFTLCGIVVQDKSAEDLKIRADRIKFKYWNDVDIVFHSRDIGLKTNEFEILRNPTTNRAFLKDLYSFLGYGGAFQCIVVSVDKTRAQSDSWAPGRILDDANDKMIEMFLQFLTRNRYRGQIVLESSSTKDIAFYKRYVKYLTHGAANQKLSGEDVKRTLTSLSFVSKSNHDIEAQLADLFAYPATCKFLHDEGIKPLVLHSYEEKMCNILNSRLIILDQAASIKSLVRLP